MEASSATVAEGATATFTLRLNGGGVGDVSVGYEVVAVSGDLTPADLERVTCPGPGLPRHRRQTGERVSNYRDCNVEQDEQTLRRCRREWRSTTWREKARSDLVCG